MPSALSALKSLSLLGSNLLLLSNAIPVEERISTSCVPSFVSSWSALSGGRNLEYVQAVLVQESGGRPGALSSVGARGLMQVTEQGAEEAARECIPLVLKPGTLLMRPDINVVYGTCLLRKYLRDTGGNWFQALILYNSGYKGLTLYKQTGKVYPETQQYLLRIMNYLAICEANR